MKLTLIGTVAKTELNCGCGNTKVRGEICPKCKMEVLDIVEMEVEEIGNSENKHFLTEKDWGKLFIQ